MVRGVAVLMLGGSLSVEGCSRASTVTMQIGEPLRADAGGAEASTPSRCHDNPDTSGEQLLEEFYRDDGRARCVVLSVVADRGDVPTRFHAVRTRRVVPPSPGAPPCLGARGAVILEDLPDTSYTLRLMVLDLDDVDAARAVPLASQDLTHAADDAWPESVCLPWFSCNLLDFSRAAVREALDECARSTTAEVPACSLGPSGGTTCPTPRP